MKVRTIRMKAILLSVLGCICLAIGGIGLAVPILPTTPFVLLAAGCFGVSSPRIYKWLENSQHFGEYIVHYKTKAGVTRRVKIHSLIFLWVMLGISIAIVESLWLRILLALIGAAVTTHILMLKSKK